jgi:hypothetical protein
LPDFFSADMPRHKPDDAEHQHLLENLATRSGQLSSRVVRHMAIVNKILLINSEVFITAIGDEDAGQHVVFVS